MGQRVPYGSRRSRLPSVADLPYENKGSPALDRRAHDGRFAAEAGAFIVGNLPREPRLLSRSYVLPRALCAAAAHAFGRSRPWFAVPCLDPDATRNGRATAAADIDRAAAAGRARSLIGTMATAPALSVPSANIGDVDACVTDAFIVVEGTASG